MKVLVIEDDEEIRTLVEYFLKKEKYEVNTISDGLKALKVIKDFRPDLIVLDLMLPNLDGINICNMIREMPDKYGTPFIIMLTAKTEVEDVLTGLKSGADDYLRKPFDPRELMVRINKILERNNKKNVHVYEFEEVQVDERKHIVFEKGKEIDLSKKEYDLLLYLIKNKGIVLTREKVLDYVWNSSYFPGDRTVDVYIGKIREKLPSIADNIRTVKGVGYKLREKN